MVLTLSDSRTSKLIAAVPIKYFHYTFPITYFANTRHAFKKSHGLVLNLIKRINLVHKYKINHFQSVHKILDNP